MSETEKVQQQVREYLETPESYPLVVPDRVKNALILAHLKAERRKYTGEPLTGFGGI